MTRLPLDKSWIKCLTILEIRGNGFGNKIQRFLNKFPLDEMSDDVKACRELLNAWHSNSYYLPVRNFRSLAVGLEMIMRSRREIKYEMLMGSQLRNRELHDKYSTQQLSAMTLCARTVESVVKEWEGRIQPYHVKIALDALVSYEVSKESKTYNITKDIYREDRTLEKQFYYFINKLQKKDIKLTIDSAEDVPLAVAFNEMDLETAEKKYPQLKNHETNRIKEMKWAFTDSVCTSKDHRIIMARAMKDAVDGKWVYHMTYPKSVNKSFPKFWDYIKEIRDIYE